MKNYRITYQDEAGAEQTRDFSAATAAEAEQYAQIEGIQPLSIKEAPLDEGFSLSFSFGGVPLSELYHFTRLFGTLVKSGVPILEAFEEIEQQTTHDNMKKTLKKLQDDVRSGVTLEAAFAAHPDVFDFTYQSLIKVGEEAGELEKVLYRLVGLIDRRIKFRRILRGAMTYPILVMVVSGGVTWGILTYIVPRFKDIYSRFKGELPGLTKFTLTVSDFMAEHTIAFVVAMMICFLTFKLAVRTQTGKALFDRFLLSLPLFGQMYHTFEIAQFSKSFSILIHSGVTVTTSMEILAPAINREPIREAILAANRSIHSGKPMGESFAEQSPWLPSLLNRMVSVGERSGNMTEMLDHVSEFYEEEFTHSVESLASLIEPILIVFLGVVIGGIVLSLYLPIFSMAKLITKR